MKNLKLYEALEESVYSEIQKMIDENQFLKGKVTADKNTIFEAGNFILLLGDLGHITDAHVDEKIPGSKFEKGVDLKKAIVSLVTNNKPNELFKGNEKVDDPKLADKFKWLGLDTKVPVGVENVHQLDVNSEEFKSLKDYVYKDSRGTEFLIKVKEGGGEKTTFLSFIGGKIGQIGDKPVLSVITAFPGKNGSTIANRNDFIKSGFYFTTQSKEVLSSVVKESNLIYLKRFKSNMKNLKHIKLYEQFLNEGVKSTKEIKVGEELYCRLDQRNLELLPIKVEVTKIVDDIYFIGKIIEIDKKTADRAFSTQRPLHGWKKGQSFKFSVESITSSSHSSDSRPYNGYSGGDYPGGSHDYPGGPKRGQPSSIWDDHPDNYR
jgi:hypothetical protein